MVPIDWIQLQEIISGSGDICIKRSLDKESKYRQFQIEVLEKYESLKSFILCNKIIPSVGQSFYLTSNDFPYNLTSDISHFIIWNTSEEKPTLDMYKKFASECIDYDTYHCLFLVNADIHQTIPDIFHCHVFLKEKTTL
jgi:hypothetical protein